MSPKNDINRPTGASILDYESKAPTRTIAEWVEDIGHLRNQTNIIVNDSSDLHHSTQGLHNLALGQLLYTKATELAKKSLINLLEELNSLGFSWQGIARISGVSVPALRKWRHGHSATSANRQRVAMVAAFCRIAEENYLIEDVAGWLETPLHPSAPITGLDLVAEERYDLALELAGTRMQNPELVLDRFEPGWKERYRSQVEVFAAPDGLPGLRLT